MLCISAAYERRPMPTCSVCLSVRPSVCLSICHVCVFCRNEEIYIFNFFHRGITISFYFFPYQTLWQYSNGDPPCLQHYYEETLRRWLACWRHISVMLQVSTSSSAETGDGGLGVRTTSTASRRWKLDDSFHRLIRRTIGQTLAVCTCSTDSSGSEFASASAASNLSSLTEGTSTSTSTCYQPSSDCMRSEVNCFQHIVSTQQLLNRLRYHREIFMETRHGQKRGWIRKWLHSDELRRAGSALTSRVF